VPILQASIDGNALGSSGQFSVAQRAQQVPGEEHALAGIECSHMGKVKRGEHMPTLAVIFKIAGALECGTAALMSEA